LSDRGHLQGAYRLLVWIEGACDWELNRRAGHDYDCCRPRLRSTRARCDEHWRRDRYARDVRPGLTGGARVLGCAGGFADREWAEAI